MEVPWEKIRVQKELKDLQRRVDKALKLLKMDKPDIQLVIRILEGKEE